MATAMVRGGTMAELKQHTGDWVFVDVGFSHSGKTCGYLHVPAQLAHGSSDKPCELTFGDTTKHLVALVKEDGPPLHLVLEAPLSVAFEDGNPLGRECEKQGNATRYWYVGLGCTVLVGSLYLLKSIVEAEPVRQVRLFEGFVSFKDRTKRSDHKGDVEALKRAVWSGGSRNAEFLEPAPRDCVTATAALLGLDLAPPPIIKVTLR